jgi:hypothetical protein
MHHSLIARSLLSGCLKLPFYEQAITKAKPKKRKRAEQSETHIVPDELERQLVDVLDQTKGGIDKGKVRN